MEYSTQDFETDWAKLCKMIDELKQEFVDRDEVIETIASGFISKTNILLIGSPGTAKSLMIKRFAQKVGIKGNDFFEYLLTKYTEPSEIFGPPNIKNLTEGGAYTFDTKSGKLQHARIAFLDEVFNANSAILNALLMIINEKRFIMGDTNEELDHLLAVFGASNHPPDDPDLLAFFDRFPIRVLVESSNDKFDKLILKSLEFEKKNGTNSSSKNGSGEIISITGFVETINKNIIDSLENLLENSDVMGRFNEFIKHTRNEYNISDLYISDRSLKSLAKMVVAYAMIQRKKVKIDKEDFTNDHCNSILKKTWNRDKEQINDIQNLLASI